MRFTGIWGCQVEIWFWGDLEYCTEGRNPECCERICLHIHSANAAAADRMSAFAVMVCSKSYRGRYASPALAAASYPFVDLPSGDTLRCKLFPADK